MKQIHSVLVALFLSTSLPPPLGPFFPYLAPFSHIVLGNVVIKRDNETKVAALL